MCLACGFGVFTTEFTEKNPLCALGVLGGKVPKERRMNFENGSFTSLSARLNLEKRSGFFQVSNAALHQSVGVFSFARGQGDKGSHGLQIAHKQAPPRDRFKAQQGMSIVERDQIHFYKVQCLCQVGAQIDKFFQSGLGGKIHADVDIAFRRTTPPLAEPKSQAASTLG